MISTETSYDINGQEIQEKVTISRESFDNVKKDIDELINYIDWSFKYIPNTDSNKGNRVKRVLEIQNNYI